MTGWTGFLFSYMGQELGQYQSQVKNEIEIKVCNFIQMHNAVTESLQIHKVTSNLSLTLDFSYNALLTLKRVTLPFPTDAKGKIRNWVLLKCPS